MKVYENEYKKIYEVIYKLEQLKDNLTVDIDDLETQFNNLINEVGIFKSKWKTRFKNDLDLIVKKDKNSAKIINNYLEILNDL